MSDEQFNATIFRSREPTLSFNEHKKFPGVGECLQIHKNIEFGRHIITTCDLQIGQTILVEEPYAIVPGNKDLSGRTVELDLWCDPTRDLGRDRCRHCFKDRMNFIPCKTCHLALFCNNDCMQKSYHKYECETPHLDMCESETFVLVLQLLFTIDAAFPDVDFLIETVEQLLNDQHVTELTVAQLSFCSIFQLVHHHEKQSPANLRRLLNCSGDAIITVMQFPDFERKYTTPRYNRFLQHLILHLFHVAEHKMSLFEIDQNDEEMMTHCDNRMYASAMYPFGCYMNHSCTPNVCRFFVDSRLIYKVIRPIKSGEQVFCSYR